MKWVRLIAMSLWAEVQGKSMERNCLVEVGICTILQKPAPQIISKTVKGHCTIRVIKWTEFQRSATECDGFIQICYGALFVVPVVYCPFQATCHREKFVNKNMHHFPWPYLFNAHSEFDKHCTKRLTEACTISFSSTECKISKFGNLGISVSWDLCTVSCMCSQCYISLIVWSDHNSSMARVKKYHPKCSGQLYGYLAFLLPISSRCAWGSPPGLSNVSMLTFVHMGQSGVRIQLRNIRYTDPFKMLM